MFKIDTNYNNNNLLMDFSCFNKVLYDNFDYNENIEDLGEKSNNNNNFKNESNISDDESSLNTSCQSIEFNDEEDIRLIPSNLLEQERYEKKVKNLNFVHNLNLNCKSYIPKSKISQNLGSDKVNNKNDNNNLCNNCEYIYNFPFFYNSNNYNNYINKKKEKKKKKFIQKEGDWVCYDCKNINFSFRKKCNRCKLLKEESETKFSEAEKRILKLYNIHEVKER